MSRPTKHTSDDPSEFAQSLAQSTAQCLFAVEWLGAVTVEHEPDPDYLDEYGPDAIASLHDDVVETPRKRSWEAPQTPMAETMTVAEIAASINAGCDPLAQSSMAEGRALRKDDPPASIIATAIGLSKLVESEEHLHALFAPGAVTNFVCPAQYLWQISQILERAMKQWKSQLSVSEGVELKFFVQDDDDRKGIRLRPAKNDMWGARLERSLAQGAAVLLVTTDKSQLDDDMNALVARQVIWCGITPEITIET